MRNLNLKLNSEVPTREEFLIYYAMKNRIAFPEIFRKIKNKPVKLRYYQIPPCCTEQVDMVGGRKQGKTFNLRNFLAQNLVAYPEKETLFTTLAKIHCDPVMDEVFDIMKKDEVLNALLATTPYNEFARTL